VIRVSYIAVGIFIMLGYHVSSQQTIAPLPKEKYIPLDELFRSATQLTPRTEVNNRYRLCSKDPLPLFCKIEHVIEQKSGIAFRFRLGNLQYVNMLENKKSNIFAE
jgi:hypothetical protein